MPKEGLASETRYVVEKIFQAIVCIKRMIMSESCIWLVGVELILSLCNYLYSSGTSFMDDWCGRTLRSLEEFCSLVWNLNVLHSSVCLISTLLSSFFLFHIFVPSISFLLVLTGKDIDAWHLLIFVSGCKGCHKAINVTIFHVSLVVDARERTIYYSKLIN